MQQWALLMFKSENKWGVKINKPKDIADREYQGWDWEDCGRGNECTQRTEREFHKRSGHENKVLTTEHCRKKVSGRIWGKIGIHRLRRKNVIWTVGDNNSEIFWKVTG